MAQTVESDDSTPLLALGVSESRDARAMRDRIESRLFGADVLPHRIAHYEVLREVGAGGMGKVYAARDTRLDRVVALKLVRRRSMAEADPQRLIREARILARLSHPNVVQVFEIGEFLANDEQDAPDVYVAMEFVEGLTLGRWHRRKRPSLGALIEVFRAAGQGLVAAHEAGIIHRDFKPSNVLVGDDGRVRVVDFGLAGPLADATTLGTASASPHSTSSHTVAGTRGYIAPELLAGRPADERSDQYAFCVSFCELLAGTRPSEDQLELSTAARRLRPTWLRNVVLRGLREDPQERWPSMATLIAELDRRPRVQRRVTLALVGVGLAVGFATSSILRAESSLCPDPSASFDAIEAEARLAVVHHRLLDSKLPWQRGLEARLRAELARQRNAWIETRTDVCEATRIDHTRSEANFDRANACLDRHLSRVDALLDLVAEADDAALARLDHQLDALGSPQACVDPVRPMPPAKYRAAVETLTQRLDRLELTVAASQTPDTKLEVAALVEAADELPFEPLRAEALALQSQIALADYDYALAAQTGFAAGLAAERSGDDEQVFRIRRHLVTTHIDLGGDLRQAEQWLAQAEATFARLGRPASLYPLLLDAQSEVAVGSNELERAEQLLREAIAASAAHSPSSPRTLQLQLSLANVLAEQGRADEARTIYIEYRDARAELLGAEHPDVGMAELNLCALELELADLDAARPHCERALQIQAASFGPGSLRTASAKTALAELALLEGDYELALRLAEEVWALQAEQLPAAHVEYGNGLALLANVRTKLGDLHGAVEAAQQLLEITKSRSNPERAITEYKLAWLLCRVERCREARAHFDTVLQLTDQDVLRVYATLGLAHVELASENPSKALEHMDALQTFADETDDAPFVAEYSLLRAWALHESGDRAQARRFLARATELYPDIGPTADVERKMAELTHALEHP